MSGTAILKHVNIPDLIEQAEFLKLSKPLNKLGYSRYEKEIKHNETLRKLTELGCKPFTEESVDSYKEYMSEKVNQDGLWNFASAALISVIGVVVFFLEMYRIQYHQIPIPNPTSASFIIALLTAFAAFVVIGFFRSEFRNRYVWNLTGLRYYEGKLPIAAAEAITMLDREFDMVTFYVDELVERSKIADPFLVMKDPHNNYYYIGVWDEDEFEAVYKDWSTLQTKLSK